MQKLKFSTKKIIYIILGFYALTPLLWFQHKKMIAGGESATYLNMDYVVNKTLMLWNDKMSSPNCESGQIIFYGPWFLLRKIGLTKEVTQRILWVFSFMLTPFSIFYLFLSLKIPIHKYVLVGALFASTLYVYNVFFMLMSQGHILRYFHSIFPFTVAFFLRGLESESLKERIKYAIYFALSFLVIGTVSANPPVITPIFIVCFAIFLLCFNKEKFIGQLKFILFTVVLTVLVNSFWLIGSYVYFINVLGTIGKSNNISIWNSLGEGKLYESIRLLGSWAFQNDTYFPWYAHYYGKSILITFFSYLIPIIAFSALLFKKSKYILLFALLSILSLFLVKGSNFPLGSFYEYLYNKYNWMHAFRSPWAKFNSITVLAYSVLFGYTCLNIFIYLNKKKPVLSYLFSCMIIIFTCITAFPLITGDIVQTTVYKTMHSREPRYWEQIGAWFEKNDPNGKVMSFPNTNYCIVYDWRDGITSSRPLAEYLIPNPHIHWSEEQFTDSYAQIITNFAYESFIKNDKEKFNNYLDLLNVGYILQQNDVNYTYRDLRAHNIWNKSRIAYLLKNNPNIGYVGSWGKLDLYKVKKENSIIEIR